MSDLIRRTLHTRYNILIHIFPKFWSHACANNKHKIKFDPILGFKDSILTNPFILCKFLATNCFQKKLRKFFWQKEMRELISKGINLCNRLTASYRHAERITKGIIEKMGDRVQRSDTNFPRNM